MTEKEKPYLEEKVIQHFEEMVRNGVSGGLGAYLKQFEDLPEIFIKLLKSYRMAARVANAAWRYIELSEQEPNNVAAIQCCIEDLQSALSDYAPQRIPQPMMERLRIRDLLISIYESIPAKGTNEEAKEIVYRTIAAVGEGQ